MKKLKASNILSSLLEEIASDSSDVFLMIADLSDSTAYKQKFVQAGMSDIYWIQRQFIFLQKCEEFIRRYDGIVFKTLGDNVMAYFDATQPPEQIFKCAIEIVQGFDNLNAFQALDKIDVKISIDYGVTYNGSLFKKDYDPIGTSVDRCSRLNSIAEKNEIIISDVFFDLLKKKTVTENYLQKYGLIKDKSILKGLGEVEYFRLFAGNYVDRYSSPAPCDD